ncbi:MAG: ATPase, T2SS/T4P/T4SS family [bacterium]
MTEHGVEWLRKRGVSDPAVLKAMAQVNREDFGANGNEPPEVVGKMIAALDLKPDATVLHVGTGSGYVTAILSKMVTAVFTVERDVEQAKVAASNLKTAGCKNVQILFGNTLKQYAANAPYDAILVSASMRELPQRLAKRLGMQGVLVAPINDGNKTNLVRLRRYTEKAFKEEILGELSVKPMLGDILVEMGVIDRADVEMAAMEADAKGLRLGEALLEGHYVKEADIFRALATQNNLQMVNAEEVLRELDRELHGAYPKPFLTHNRILPFARRDGLLHVITTDPYANGQDLAQAMGLIAIRLYLTTPTDFQVVLHAAEGRPQLGNQMSEVGASPSVAIAQDNTGTFDAETIAFFEKLIVQAVNSRASDVHFERYEQDVRVRLRIDGDMQDKDVTLSPKQMNGVVHLVKISGRMDGGEKRRPQMGHFQRRVDGKVYDIRARTQPTNFGETVTLRLLPQDERIRTLGELGFEQDVASHLRAALDRRSGVFLVVGPTGAGKSTTVYAALHALTQDHARKVLSVEHPVSYALPGVHQVKVDPRYGFDVAAAIEASMGDDADVLLVGDISTPDVATWAFKASQAGHLVVGTVFGKDAIDGIRALRDLGVDSDAIATELVGIVAQRLAKRICEDCSAITEFTPETLHEVFGDAPPEVSVFAGKGCAKCNGRGTLGRIAVTEFLPVQARVRRQISARDTVEGLREAAAESGLQTLRDNAIRLVDQGIIPQDELRWIPSWK